MNKYYETRDKKLIDRSQVWESFSTHDVALSSPTTTCLPRHHHVTSHSLLLSDSFQIPGTATNYLTRCAVDEMRAVGVCEPAEWVFAIRDYGINDTDHELMVVSQLMHLGLLLSKLGDGKKNCETWLRSWILFVGYSTGEAKMNLRMSRCLRSQCTVWPHQHPKIRPGQGTSDKQVRNMVVVVAAVAMVQDYILFPPIPRIMHGLGRVAAAVADPPKRPSKNNIIDPAEAASTGRRR